MSADTPKARLSFLSTDKLELLALFRAQSAREAQCIRKLDRGGGKSPPRFPLSWSQERLWLADRVEGGRAGYIAPMAVRFHGPMEPSRLQAALEVAVQRHESLRTVFVTVDGVPMQEVKPDMRCMLRVIDLTKFIGREQEEMVRQHRMEEVRQGFDLRSGPLIRVQLHRLKVEEHLLVVTMHHIIADGWSLGVFLRDLAEVYAASLAQRQACLPPLSIHYADYAHWQRQRWSHGEELEKQLSYWKGRLAGAAVTLSLPTDRPRTAHPSHAGETLNIILNTRLTAQLKRFAQVRGITLFMTLCAALSVLLATLTGQEDIVISTPVANRARRELEPLIGLFVNMLLLRVNIHREMLVDGLIEQIKLVTLGAYDHHEVPYEKVAHILQPCAESSGSFPHVTFVLHNEPAPALDIPNVSTSIESEVDEPSINDLWISLEERDAKLVGYVNYASELFDRSTVSRWMSDLSAILDLMTQGMQGKVLDLAERMMQQCR